MDHQTTGNRGENQGTEQLRQKAGEMKGDAQEMAAAAQRAAAEAAEQYRQMAAEYYEQGRHRAEELTGQLENYIREQPLKSVMIAAGVGLVVGLVLLRR